tara:strand:- start:9745 stop:10245 length:501 start_codon:yes stop_codon:yes gene_type:complete
MSRTKDRALKTAKEARDGKPFLPFRLDVLQSPALAALSPIASKLLLDIASQWKLGHNGDASTAFEKVLRSRGWVSKATLYKALKELRSSGLIIQTRQGSLHQCSLYALGWLAIDECGGKLDVNSTTRPLNPWLTISPEAKNVVRSTQGVLMQRKNIALGTRSVPSG